ncbi:MAG: class II glutamine amidotransferase [Myxococcota bacterium]
MPNVLMMSFDGLVSPSFTLHQTTEEDRPDGWGLGYYGHGEESATVFKETTPPQGVRRPAYAPGIEQLASSVFLAQVRWARWGSANRQSNTQPFSRSWRGRDWLFAHAGSLDHRLEVVGERLFEPVGSTDSELLFCELLNNIAERRWRNLGYADFALMHQWFSGFNDYGQVSMVLTDGRDMVVYADRSQPLHMWTLRPPHGSLVFRGRHLEVDLAARGSISQKGTIVASSPVEVGEDCRGEASEIEPGSLVVVRDGAIQHRVGRAPGTTPGQAPVVLVRGRVMERPRRAPVRTFEVLHETIYRYESAVEHSTHMLRLTPFHDRMQRLLSHDIEITADCREREFDDVFGNSVRKLLVETPFDEMKITARSKVRVLDTDPLSYRPLHARTTIPLVWMPWQRHMLTPYLLPPELPETQLLELIDYARGFVRRNDGDLLDTLLDINTTIYSDYEYVPGSTSVTTSAWEIYERRRGVCQDFSNLFICLARLLGVPARYVCGYIYTGPKQTNQVQSEASHAWVQLYLPEVGWKGFDPTNGILTQTEHVRVAVGRNYIDATPTSGTIYVGGGGETLSAEVRVEPIVGEEEAEAADERSSLTHVVLGGQPLNPPIPLRVAPDPGATPASRDNGPAGTTEAGTQQPKQQAQQSTGSGSTSEGSEAAEPGTSGSGAAEPGASAPESTEPEPKPS